jgi:hypothetical protein
MFVITSSIGPQNVPPLIELVFIFSGLVRVFPANELTERLRCLFR